MNENVIVMSKDQQVAYSEYASAVADVARLEKEMQKAQERFRTALTAMNQTVIPQEAK